MSSIKTRKNSTTEKDSDVHKVADVTTKAKRDVYHGDSSDEEDVRNTIGNVPLYWYDTYPHVGYSTHGEKLLKPSGEQDELDMLLRRLEDPEYWRTVRDRQTGQQIVLSESDAQISKRVKDGKFPDLSYDAYEPWIDFFTHDKMIHPVTGAPAHKRSFIPSKLERFKVGQMVHAIKMGWIKPKEEKDKETDEESSRNFYMLWKNEEAKSHKGSEWSIPAPKLMLPGHEESYNPAGGFSKQEESESSSEEEDEKDKRKKKKTISSKYRKSYSSLRLVPSYPKFINERFDRCLDLYLCPRQRKMTMNVDVNDLLPKLPNPKDLQPFPTTESIIYKGHSDAVTCTSLDPTGQWLASGSDDSSVRLWEISTGRCLRCVQLESAVTAVQWNLKHNACLMLVASGEKILVVNSRLGDKLASRNADNLLSVQHFTTTATATSDGSTDAAEENSFLKWTSMNDSSPDSVQSALNPHLSIEHTDPVVQATWHKRGDYFASVQKTESRSQQVVIHQLSTRKSQKPFSKMNGLVQCLQFHPSKPYIFVATQTFVYMYSLTKREKVKTLRSSTQWISSLAMHPAGDNLIVGGYDGKLSWFDLELSTKPYKTLRNHKKGIREVCFHPTYPLFASASGDGTLTVYHGETFTDLLQSPLIIPVKLLHIHQQHSSSENVSSGQTLEKSMRGPRTAANTCIFHPTQPWLLAGASDCTIRLFT